MITRVYFYCRDNPHAYQDDVVVLADGLRQLGVEVYGNCNYWRQSPDSDSWLVRHDPTVQPDDCDVVVVSYLWSRWIEPNFKVHEQTLPSTLFAPNRRYRTVYLDLDDGYETCSWRPAYRAFDLILRAKYNERCFRPKNHRPWALGLNSRVLTSTQDAPKWSARNREVLINFGASHPYIHGARSVAGPRFIAAARACFAINEKRDDLRTPPSETYDLLMWEQTQHRHSSAYYERLKNAQAIVAFCGELIPPTPFQPRYLAGGRRAKFSLFAHRLLSKIDPRPPRLIQWDSWRFWEGLTAGALVFNLDLPHYGVKLPVMPENFVHYIGLQLDNMTEAFTRLQNDPGLAERIAAQGRAWALEHYSPIGLARQFLKHIS